ncbi:uncharacterized protein KLLA0_D09108g [Kluyveromyces lactis]|uniref:KLLA0D09108p n=1 Tax=Kluyveromyces lactis (strain ATCC 8585 / CBS 2359 / DSM 70799 / NBRC 1267 / NRRL Y-1140 / WM37) TaxID=284590 RepID=Q6CRH1_KLULA|nr:uncharacterized protein KLLA0_D09108g [Kluyveromyces lactis]CAH00564.1 KLLA0D09108p [Kluyveromyces lactis]|eukprot:XP_453468.1 uncharacterized protein KLLA0_D09108g [Kluyveromyces lactis]
MTERPIRVVILGGSSTGKTSFASRLTVNLVHEVHYPTRKQTNWLFTFKPSSPLARFLMDRKCHARLKNRTRGEITAPLIESPELTSRLLLSPFIFNIIMQEYKYARDHNIKDDADLKRDNHVYKYLDSHDEINEKNVNLMTNSNGNIASDQHCKNSLSIDEFQKRYNLEAFRRLGYIPPSYTDISIDIIDTPGFNPDMVVPFLELSLFSNLGKPRLRGLADEPRKPVSTQPILVASGAAELNGRVDGYFLVYSLVPELNKIDALPSYTDANADSHDISPLHSASSNASNNRKNSWSEFDDGGFSLLTTIRNCFLDAWKEYRNYQKLTKDSAETDIYSLMQNLKQMWKSEVHTKENQRKKLITTLKDINLAPDAPDSPPPIIIIGTHMRHDLASPVLLQWGKDLALQWNCGFVGLDSMTDDNVDVAFAMLLREIIERDTAICKKRTKKSTLGRLL